MSYHVIYDGNCNLCVNLVRSLETLYQGKLFSYTPMQDEQTLAQWGVTPQDCEMGMILIDANAPEKRWQGSDAAEDIGRLLPMGSVSAITDISCLGNELLPINRVFVVMVIAKYNKRQKRID